MAHDNYVMLISLDLDGMLSERERDNLRQHTRTCAACADSWERMRRMDSMFKVQPELAPSKRFAAKVTSRVAAYERQRKLMPLLLAVLGGIAVAGLLSLAIPVAVVRFELYRPLLEVPVLGGAVSWIARGFNSAAAIGRIGLRDLIRWLAYLTTDPIALGVVIAGLVSASTWIGLREVSRPAPAAELSRQRA